MVRQLMVGTHRIMVHNMMPGEIHGLIHITDPAGLQVSASTTEDHGTTEDLTIASVAVSMLTTIRTMISIVHITQAGVARATTTAMVADGIAHTVWCILTMMTIVELTESGIHEAAS